MTPLKEKSQAGMAFIDFKVFFEKQTRCKVKKFITDGGGEFVKNSLSLQLKELAIQHNILPPYTPQHNGVAERANKNIINMACCMLIHSGLAKEWWGEAVKTAMAVTNCLPSLGRSCLSPIEQFFGKWPNFSIFKPFGCEVFFIRPQACRTFKFGTVWSLATPTTTWLTVSSNLRTSASSRLGMYTLTSFSSQLWQPLTLAKIPSHYLTFLRSALSKFSLLIKESSKPQPPRKRTT
jgi:hypothetical protein